MPLEKCKYCNTTQTSDNCNHCNVSERADIQRLLDALDNLTKLSQEYIGKDYLTPPISDKLLEEE